MADAFPKKSLENPVQGRLYRAFWRMKQARILAGGIGYMFYRLGWGAF